jgi:DNA (cytosine-5)-methyltransferase 1
MRYLSVCSGIEAATVAWHPLGWTPVGFSEIEAFPSAVLAHHYPDIPNYGDMTQHEQWPITRGAIDLLVGGTPCQSFSVAGLRQGLRDPRGGLMLTYLEIAQRLRPRWVVWENVPGVLSSNGGRDFGAFLGALGELGYGWAYRVLDAQWCRTHRHPRAVPQRRRRVFVVGCLGDGTAAAAVLFERESVRRDTAAGAAAWKGAAPDVEGCAPTVCSKWGRTGSGGPAGDECQNLLPQWWDGSEAASTLTCRNAGLDQRMPDVSPRQFTAVLQPVVGALTAKGPTSMGAPEVDAHHYIAGTLGNRGTRSHTELDGHGAYILMSHAMTVRRLTPRECERLQGFPDDYTAIPWRGKAETPDGPRYKALGNSMAVNCMEWIGERIAAQEAR